MKDYTHAHFYCTKCEISNKTIEEDNNKLYKSLHFDSLFYYNKIRPHLKEYPWDTGNDENDLQSIEDKYKDLFKKHNITTYWLTFKFVTYNQKNNEKVIEVFMNYDNPDLGSDNQNQPNSILIDTLYIFPPKYADERSEFQKSQDRRWISMLIRNLKDQKSFKATFFWSNKRYNKHKDEYIKYYNRLTPLGKLIYTELKLQMVKFELLSY